ncbi:MAG TPA: hypothetical protein DDY29_08125 [Rhodobacteraceae bacterium]|nr:hypothetical protein [Paracoccaceae bacterium]
MIPNFRDINYGYLDRVDRMLPLFRELVKPVPESGWGAVGVGQELERTEAAISIDNYEIGIRVIWTKWKHKK